ncbi:MAG: DnaJ domain-containing protein [Thermodesulfobacteriota bacterium]|nr:DnaJ domain-containing protein [Thermodesulfobacteriota bacterium]
MVKIILSVLALFYILCPYDLFPDMIFGWGWIDDLIILYFLWRYFYSQKQKGYKYANHEQGSHQSFASDKHYRFRKEPVAEDPYTVLGIPRDAAEEQIKTAYRELANKYHPDKVLHLGEEFRELAEKRFKEIQKAYKELVDK